MKSVYKILMALTFVGFTAHAKKEAASVTVADAQILVPMKGTTVTAGYGLIKNTSKSKITLKLKSAAPFKAAEIHESVEKDGKMAMNKLDQIVLEPGTTLTLKPGGHHLMFFDPSKEVKVGEKINVEFEQDGKPLKLIFAVAERKATEEHHEHSHH